MSIPGGYFKTLTLVRAQEIGISSEQMFCVAKE